MTGPLSQSTVASRSSSGTPNPMTVIASDTWKTNLANQLAQGGDCLVGPADSIFAGTGDSWNNAVQQQLRTAFLDRYQNSGYESGPGFYCVGDLSNGATGAPSYFHEGGFNATKSGENYYFPRMAICPNSASACRFSFPTTLYGRKIKRMELVISTFGTSTTAPTIVVDAYSVPTPQPPTDDYQVSGFASTIVHDGLTGVTTTYTPGNVTNAPMHKLGILPITFNGTTHNPTIQVSSSSPVAVLGVILYCDDWDIDGKGVRFHGMAAAGFAAFGGRYNAQNPVMDSGAVPWYRSFLRDDYCYGISNTAVTTSPTSNGKLLIWEAAINDRIIWTNSLADFLVMVRDTTDLIMTTSDKIQILFVIPYVIGGGFDSWRKGYDGATIDPEGTWTAYTDVFYQVQAKYPDRIAILNLYADLGYQDYASAITARGWNTVDGVHWKNGGPGYAASRIMSVLPSKASFNKATGVSAATISNNLTHAYRFDGVSPKNWGSASGTLGRNASGALPSLRSRRTRDGKSMSLAGTTGYGFVTSGNVAIPTGDCSMFVRMKLTADPGSSMAYISSVFGEESGPGGTFQLRLGDGLSNQIRVPSFTNASTRATAAVPLNQYSVFGFVRSGSTVTYYIDGVAAGAATATTVTATTMPFRVGEITGFSGRPAKGEVSHAFLWTRALSGTEVTNLAANPDLPFTLT